MKTWRVAAGSRIEGLTLGEEPPAALGPRQVRVRLHAASLNYRDLMVLNGWYPVELARRRWCRARTAPAMVVEAGSAVTRFKAGDRVTTSFFPNWVDGPHGLPGIAGALGGGGAGTFARGNRAGRARAGAQPRRTWITPRRPPSPAPASPPGMRCSRPARMRPGETVLLLGTGGVSIWALQLAKAAGARVIITSSSDAKLDQGARAGRRRGHQLRAASGVVRRSAPAHRRRRRGPGAGSGRRKDRRRSRWPSVRMQGTMVVIGGVSGFGGAIVPRSLIVGATRVQGVYVGSRADARGPGALRRGGEDQAGGGHACLPSPRRRRPTGISRPASISARWRVTLG